MTPGEFLRAIWPSEGIYCIAVPFIIPGTSERVYAHRTFDDLSAAVSFVLGERSAKDMFFAVHTLKEHQRWNPEKINRKTGQLGSNETRVRVNMKAGKAFFFDLDVGDELAKYQSQVEAGADLIRFCKEAQLPKPLVINSGGGLHVYWLLSHELESEAWRTEANKLKQLALHHGLKIDRSRTTDSSSVLRVAGTFNWKDRSSPRPVMAVTIDPPVTGTGAFIKMLDEAVIRAGVDVKPLPQLSIVAQLLGSNTEREFSGPPVSLWALLKSCKQMERLALAAKDKKRISEPEWYYGIIGIGRFLEDGHRRIMQFGDASWHAAIKEKIKQSEQHQKGPTSCAKLAEISDVGDEPCIGCPFAGKVHGPLGAARFNDPAPPPQVMELREDGLAPVAVTIPDPPPPYTRLRGGGVAAEIEDASGVKSHHVIYEHDLYPIRRLSNPYQGTEQQVWHVDLPRNDSKDFTLDADMLYDSKKFVAAIANQGVYPNKGHITSLQEYMVAYIAQLQKLVDADEQCNHLGWTDDFTRFILPDKILAQDGTVRTTQLSTGAQRSSLNVHKKGSLEKQVELLKFYEHPIYRPNQFFILASIAAPLMYMTGHHGVIVNASGDAGASKSTSLYTAASFWGQPELYPINGTNNGATVRGRNERLTVLANLPVCVDEITHMPPKDAIDLAMSITQPGHRIRLQTDGVERAALESYKATIMLATANNSLHGVLSSDNAQGTAGSMRVFEIRFEKTSVHTKTQADEYLFALKQNYGHIGELVIRYVLANHAAIQVRVREKMALIDRTFKIESSERFWSATVALVLVMAEITREVGVLNYDHDGLLEWIGRVQIPFMRGIVRDEYSDPLGILSDYLEQISSNMLVMERIAHAGGNLPNVHRRPTGALLAHYDLDDKLLYVLRSAFKDHCMRIGANGLKIINELSEVRGGERIIISPHSRRTLGAGTEYAKSQTWCFVINMAHKEVSGVVDLKTIQGGGQQGSSDTKGPGLQLVQ